LHGNLQRLKLRPAFAGERIGGCGEGRGELSGGEGVEGAEAGGEFGVGDAAVAVEPAEEVFGGGLALFRVAIATARDKVAVGVAPRLGLRDDMVDGAYEDSKVAQAVKAEATLARVDGPAQSLVFEEIGVRDARSERQPGRAADSVDIGTDGANLLGQTDHDHVTDLVAFDQSQDAEIEEASQRAARGHGAEADTAGEPGNGKTEAEPPFEAAVAEEMTIDRAVDDGQAQPGNEQVVDLLPDLCGVGDFVFHV
jgi:hypothetical protein